MLPIDQQLRDLRFKYCSLLEQVVAISNILTTLTGIKLPILGISGGNGADDPINGTSTYTNVKLAKIAINNSNRFIININGAIWTSFSSSNGNVFSFNRSTNTITFDPTVFQFSNEDFIQIDLNQ